MTYPVAFPRLTIGDKTRLVSLWEKTSTRKTYIRELLEMLVQYAAPKGQEDTDNIDSSIFKYFKRINSFGFWNFTKESEFLGIYLKVRNIRRYAHHLKPHCPFDLNVIIRRKIEARKGQKAEVVFRVKRSGSLSKHPFHNLGKTKGVREEVGRVSDIKMRDLKNTKSPSKRTAKPGQAKNRA